MNLRETYKPQLEIFEKISNRKSNTITLDFLKEFNKRNCVDAFNDIISSNFVSTPPIDEAIKTDYKKLYEEAEQKLFETKRDKTELE